MKEYAPDRIRNVALVSHQGTGKTSLVEAMLYDTGCTTRLGKVEEGNTVSDWDPDEVKHHVSINASLAPVEFDGCKINLIDTPGYADFVGEVKEGLRVADAALLLVSAVDGLQVGTEMAWQLADQHQLPRIIFINKLDRENADFDAVVRQLRDRFGTRVVPFQAPIGREQSFRGLVDILDNKAYEYASGKPTEVPLTAETQAEFQEYRQQLVETVCETDDVLMDKYLEEEETPAYIKH